QPYGFRKYGKKLFDDLTKLAGIKHRYGFSWSNIFKLYEYGIRAVEGRFLETHLLEMIYMKF
ncbi:MAG: hypothetical protein QXJ46_06030, partial [Candidatus Bathyarchaeia archaeon]